MSRNYLIDESFSYKALRALYRYLFMSVSFRALKRLIRIVSDGSIKVMSASESRRLFLSLCHSCRKRYGYFVPSLIFSIFICQLVIGFFVFGKIRYPKTLPICALLLVIYVMKKGTIKRLCSFYKNSGFFNILNNKI